MLKKLKKLSLYKHLYEKNDFHHDNAKPFYQRSLYQTPRSV